MTSQQFQTTANSNGGEEVGWQLPVIRKEHLLEAQLAAQDLCGVLGNGFFSSLVAPASSTTENITQFCARGLTAKELVLRLSVIKEAKIRDSLAKKT